GDEPLLRSLIGGHPDLMQRLSPRDRSRLVDAAQDNNLTAVKLMLSVGWPTDVRGQHGATALHWAAFHGSAELTREILRRNPPLESKDQDFGGTPLGWAMYGSLNGWHPESGDYAGVVRALLDAGAERPAGDPQRASEAVL